jgi:hypothetical protein
MARKDWCWGNATSGSGTALGHWVRGIGLGYWGKWYLRLTRFLEELVLGYYTTSLAALLGTAKFMPVEVDPLPYGSGINTIQP